MLVSIKCPYFCISVSISLNVWLPSQWSDILADKANPEIHIGNDSSRSKERDVSNKKVSSLTQIQKSLISPERTSSYLSVLPTSYSWERLRKAVLFVGWPGHSLWGEADWKQQKHQRQPWVILINVLLEGTQWGGRHTNPARIEKPGSDLCDRRQSAWYLAPR